MALILLVLLWPILLPVMVPVALVRAVAILSPACPCGNVHYDFGDITDPHSWSWTWRDGREHRLAERPPGESDEKLLAWAHQTAQNHITRLLMANTLVEWRLAGAP
jgi:hypothetical protein